MQEDPELMFLNQNLEWKFFKNVVGTAEIVLPQYYRELFLDAYYGSQHFVFLILKSILTPEDRYYRSGQVVSINVNMTRAKLVLMEIQTDVTALSSLALYYR